ncbi:serine/threonine protein phosphatase [Shewanella mesophila]|uniref:lipopolysaccharide kinase InaA family protein n=1 Tax=Shewanella mesophila TaxID=2864208 RepID=UPI001C65D110|nr:lipopolysaccharide kinase InaA family protein [Shewanella mesophila]QYJ87565.1 serine/threonine protein phosphatase [Shewanella mesophila]
MTKPAIQAVVDQVLAANKGKRVVSFEYEGKTYWLKQTEQLTGAMRLLKSQPGQSLQLEIATLQSLAQKGAPVPELVAFGDNYLVVADVGSPVNHWLDKRSDSDMQAQILKDSAIGLAKLHQKGLAHGRPALRDICWKEGEVSFIDFEANQKDTDIEKQQVRDLLVYIHSLYRYIGPHPELVEPAICAYREAGGESLWQASRVRIRRWQWLNYLIAPLKTIGGKDLRPVYWLLKHFASA